MRKIVRYLLIILKSFLIFVALGAVSTATVKNFQKIMIVDEFKSKAIFEEEKSTDKYKPLCYERFFVLKVIIIAVIIRL